jgi:hypothetical protein
MVGFGLRASLFSPAAVAAEAARRRRDIHAVIKGNTLSM